MTTFCSLRVPISAALLALLCFTAARAAEPTTPEDVVARAEARFRSAHDYEYVVESDTRAGTKREAGTYHVWCKQPGMLRLRVIHGDHRGSEIAMDRGGQVRAHDGGLLKPIVIKMSRTDHRLKGLRGTCATDMDWGTFFKELREHAARPAAHWSLAPHKGAEAPYVVTVSYKDDGKPMRDIAHFDPHTFLVTEWEVFEGDQRVEHSFFRDIKFDTGVPEKFFRL